MALETLDICCGHANPLLTQHPDPYPPDNTLCYHSAGQQASTPRKTPGGKKEGKKKGAEASYCGSSIDGLVANTRHFARPITPPGPASGQSIRELSDLLSRRPVQRETRTAGPPLPGHSFKVWSRQTAQNCVPSRTLEQVDLSRLTRYRRMGRCNDCMHPLRGIGLHAKYIMRAP